MLALSSLAVACGGGGSDRASLDDWVADVCDLARDYQPDFDSIQADFDAVDLETDPAKAHDQFISLLEEGRDIQKDMVADFKKLGEPDIEDGKAVVDAFVANFEEQGEMIDRLINGLKELDPEKDEYPFAFLAVLLSVGETESLRDRLDTLAEDNQDIEDLIAAIEEDPDCAKIVFELDDDFVVDEDLDLDATPVEDWVSGFCTAFVSYIDDLEAISDDLSVQDVNDLESARQALVAAFEDARNRSEDLQFDIFFLGAPDIPDGADIQAALELGVSDIVTTFDLALSEAEALDTRDATTFLRDVEALTRRFEEAFDELASSFDALDAYDTSEIDRLAEELPECAALG